MKELTREECLAGVATEHGVVKARILPKSECPYCHAELTACTSVGSDVASTIPTIGKLTVCVACGTLLEFAEVGYKLAADSRKSEFSQRTIALIEDTIKKPLRTGP